jgi:hypothetical protein
MPHVSDVRSTSHDQHDSILVAALAADDLAGTDRDRAIALTNTCAECATLRDDLLALASATAATPPPIATRPRDFQLTAADAARLRPGGWRRLVGAVRSSRAIVSRPLGVGLATLGLAGLLIGNVQLGLGSAAGAPGQAVVTGAGNGAVPAASGATAQERAAADAAALGSSSGSAAGASSAPAAAPGTIAGSVASAGAATSLPNEFHVAPLAPSSAGGKSLASPVPQGDAPGFDSTTTEPLRPLNLLFGAVFVIGLGVLVTSVLRGRRTV